MRYFSFLFISLFCCFGYTLKSYANPCISMIPQAEKLYGIPSGMLLSIAHVESGYKNQPWPWTLNKNGKAYYPETYQEALNLLKTKDGFAKNTAVGCMQLYTNYHKEKFRTPEDMINPYNNVLYAASYLKHLKETYGSWIQAVARYHSSKQVYQVQYLCNVVDKRISFGYQNPTQWYFKNCGKTLAKK